MIVRAFGLYWSITGVEWDAKEMLGVDDEDKPTVETNAWIQSGIYCLYDGYLCVYVGKAENGNLGERIDSHRNDRLAGRWDSLSWFGVHRVKSDGGLQAFDTRLTERADIIKSLEAFAQIAFDPRLNRRHERPPEAVEFIQKAERPKAIRTLVEEIHKSVSGLASRSSAPTEEGAPQAAKQETTA